MAGCSLRDLIRSAQTRTVRVDVGGESKEIVLRSLAGWEQSLIERLTTPPRPPMVDQVGKGSLAPKVPDDKDAGYLSELEKTWRRRRLAWIAASSEYPASGTLDMDGETGLRWSDIVAASNAESPAVAALAGRYIATAYTELSELLPSTLAALFDHVVDISTVSVEGLDRAEKN